MSADGAAGAPPAPSPQRPQRRVGSSQEAAAARAARLLAARREIPRRTRPGQPRRVSRPTRALPERQREPVPANAAPGRTPRRQAPALVVGLVLTAAVALELYLALAAAGSSAGRILLAVGLLLDAGARALGAIAAVRSGRGSWAWLCLALGSPAVAAFALFGADGPVELEPAPLAGLLSLVALGVAAIAVFALAFGV